MVADDVNLDTDSFRAAFASTGGVAVVKANTHFTITSGEPQGLHTVTGCPAEAMGPHYGTAGVGQPLQHHLQHHGGFNCRHKRINIFGIVRCGHNAKLLACEVNSGVHSQVLLAGALSLWCT